jgi:nitrogen fixation NifU-like protein
MGNSLDDFVNKLQGQIYEETREAYGETVLRRWLNPLYKGSIADPDGHAALKGRCGDKMEIFLKFEGERVREAAFQTDGCGSSTACGSFAAEMALGKTPDELLEITGEAILEKTGGLPKEESHCAFLAAETVGLAVNDYMIKQTKKVRK